MLAPKPQVPFPISIPVLGILSPGMALGLSPSQAHRGRPQRACQHLKPSTQSGLPWDLTLLPRAPPPRPLFQFCLSRQAEGVREKLDPLVPLGEARASLAWRDLQKELRVAKPDWSPRNCTGLPSQPPLAPCRHRALHSRLSRSREGQTQTQSQLPQRACFLPLLRQDK